MTTTVPARVSPAKELVAARKPGKLRLHNPATPYLLCAPYLLLLLTFVLGPAVFGIWVSLHAWDFMLPFKPFIGLDNYKALMDPTSVIFELFWNGMRNTAICTVASVPFLVIIPLLIAILLNRKFPGRTFFRAMIFAPFVLGIAVIGVLFNYLLDTQFGLVNYLLVLVGIAPVGWVQTQPWAWVALVGMTVWWTLGFNTVIYLAGLGNIPNDQYEAAELDGAGVWGKFRFVTLPGLRPVLVSLGARHITTGRFVLDTHIDHLSGGPVLVDETSRACIDRTVAGFRDALGLVDDDAGRALASA